MEACSLKPIEKIPVYVRIVNGYATCICHASAKRCKMPCERGVVSRDRYEQWQATMKRDRYGK